MPQNVLFQFGAHGTKIREVAGNFMESSAFPFESMFATMKRKYCSGTQNIGKQILQNMFIDYELQTHHLCQAKLPMQETDKNFDKKRYRDDLVYTYVGGCYKFYRVANICTDSVVAYSFISSALECPIDGFEQVGVHKVMDVSIETEEVHRINVQGKAMLVGKYIITCPNSVLENLK